MKIREEVLARSRCGNPDIVTNEEEQEENCRSCGHWWSIAEDD
jgi:hypothetical protein